MYINIYNMLYIMYIYYAYMYYFKYDIKFMWRFNIFLVFKIFFMPNKICIKFDPGLGDHNFHI